MFYWVFLLSLCISSVCAFLPSVQVKVECGGGVKGAPCYRHDSNLYSQKLLPRRSSKTTKHMMLPPDSGDPLMVSGLDPTLTIVLIAGSLGVLSQTLINSMLKGDQGLSAFLSDGKGFQNSNFKQRRKDENDNAPLGGDDPLPWLKLPKFSYVEVAGQENEVPEDVIVARLEELAAKMRSELEVGEKGKAAETMQEMNDLMERYGFDYKPN